MLENKSSMRLEIVFVFFCYEVSLLGCRKQQALTVSFNSKNANLLSTSRSYMPHLHLDLY